jgi:hypothetical protein
MGLCVKIKEKIINLILNLFRVEFFGGRLLNEKIF